MISAKPDLDFLLDHIPSLNTLDKLRAAMRWYSEFQLGTDDDLIWFYCQLGALTVAQDPEQIKIAEILRDGCYPIVTPAPIQFWLEDWYDGLNAEDEYEQTVALHSLVASFCVKQLEERALSREERIQKFVASLDHESVNQ